MSQQQPTTPSFADQPTLFGQPAGLYTLFFAEMWERFSFYGMRAILVFYMMKGFLGYGDSDAYSVYGAYTALVYMTPFFGGMLADRLLGGRRAVVFGGLLMAVGEACLMYPSKLMFFGGLAMLIVGNGFFKPNISNIVGTLYKKMPRKRDGGFTIFYMGINLGAAISPLLCGYIGEKYDWKYGFGLATLGMLVGLAVFVAPRIVTIFMILTGSLAAAAGLIIFHPLEVISTGVNVFVALALVASAVIAVIALYRGGLPAEAGAPPDPAKLRRRVAGIIPVEWVVYLGTLILVPVFVLLVSGGKLVYEDGRPITLVNIDTIERLEKSDSAAERVAGVCLKQVSQPVGVVLTLAALLAFGYLIVETFRLPLIPRHHMYVVLILTFFCMLFWAFFEQAGSSINNFTDRNIDRVFGQMQTVTEAEVGQTIRLEPTQEQLGYYNGDHRFTLTDLDKVRKIQKQEVVQAAKLQIELSLLAADSKAHRTKEAEYARVQEQAADLTIPWQVTEENVGMQLAKQADEVPASLLLSANPIYILLLGLVFTALWSFLGTRGIEPSTPVKFALGLLQLGLGFAVLWYGTTMANDRGMVAISWLLLGYLLHTTGELCLSPVGLSMISKLSPARLVSTVMGAWFLATSLSQFMAAVIAQFTRVGTEEGAASIVPPPIDTVHVYGNVFGFIAIASVASAFICFCLVPLLKKWMHDDEEVTA